MKAVIFDLDGTLVNSLGDIKEAINYARSLASFPPISDKETSVIVGKGLKNALLKSFELDKEIISEEKLEHLYKKLMEYYISHPVTHSFLYPGIPKLLSDLKKEKFLIGVLSNKDEEILLSVAKTFFSASGFSFIIGGKKGGFHKPDPRALDEIIKSYNLKKEDILYIGDTEIDFAFASACQVKSIIVSYGFRGKEYLKEKGITDTLNHVPSIKEINEAFSKHCL